MIVHEGRQICIDPSIPLLSVLGKKYTMLILGVLGNVNHGSNFNEIRRVIPGSSSTMISKRLADLTDLGLVKRYEADGRIMYSLTDLGITVRRDLIPIFSYMEEHPH
ncbi:MAG: helix-turn-helix domain-containing protein [Thermoplasmataceae archaeon]